jgi:hypothetical protein
MHLGVVRTDIKYFLVCHFSEVLRAPTDQIEPYYWAAYGKMIIDENQ